MKEGQRVRFTAANLGIMPIRDASYFDKDSAHRGDEGSYAGPNLGIREEDWHWVRLDDGRFVPVHQSQFEAAE